MCWIVIAILTTLSVSACDSAHERLIKTMEKQISQTTQIDWKNGIPLDDLVDAHKMCQQKQEQPLQGCDVVISQLTDIATSLESCKADQRSKLCKIVVQAISKNSVLAILPESDALSLPNNPWYLSLPTKALETQSSKFGYRIESASWWWQEWSTRIIFGIALLVIFIGAWRWWRQWRSAKQQRAATMARQDIARIEQEQSRRIRDKQTQADAAHQAKLAREAAIAEQQQVAMENLTKQQEEQVAAKLAAEQAEVAKLLASAFMPSGSKQRKTHAPTSK